MSTNRRRGRPKRLPEPDRPQISEVYVDTTCDVCDAEFLDFEDLQVHMNQVHPTTADKKPKDFFRGFSCYFCPEYHTSQESLSLHIRDDHMKSLYYCQYCLRVFTNYQNQKSHEQLHVTGKLNRYSCTNCPLFLYSPEELQKHDYEEHQDSMDGIILYELFPYLTSQLNIVVDYVLKSAKKNGQKFSCSCTYTTSTLRDHLDHLKLNNCSSLVCVPCLKPYKNRKNLTKHILKNKCYLRGTMRRCDVCKLNLLIEDFDKHRRNCLRRMICENCGKHFKNSLELSKHKVQHETVIKMKSCYYCRLQLFNLRVYRNHVIKCHGKDYKNYKYECAYCDFVFNHPQKLFAHFYSRHKDLNPFRCNICDKEFRIRKQFTIHIKFEHKSVGFIEFTDTLNVHFNKEKSNDAYQPAEREKLFTDEDEEDFMKAGLDIAVTTKVKAKPKVKRRKESVDDSDDEPLIKKRNITAVNKLEKLVSSKVKKSNRLTCKTCKKFCYTVQNFNRHVALHLKERNFECIKCGARFKTQKQLRCHLEKNHETAHITSKLKSLLEKKKMRGKYDVSEPKTKRFEKTITKVAQETDNVKATIKEVKETSAKNFLETFKPNAEKTEKLIEIEASVTIKPVVNKKRQFRIKMVKCDLTPLPTVYQQLKMPERVNLANDLMKAKVKLQVARDTHKPKLNYGVREDLYNEIPEVGEEVVCNEQELYMKPKVDQTSQNESQNECVEVEEIILPELPKGYGPFKVATLQEEAPYFKIVPLDSLVAPPPPPKIEEKYAEADEIQLPSGTLVRANPLAHLMKGKSIEDLGKRKNYTPKLKNPQKALANALMKLADRDKKCVEMKKKKQTVKRKLKAK